MLDEENNLKRKADIFTKRTIRPHEAITSVDTASEALALSISEKPAWTWTIWRGSLAKVRKS